MPAGTLVKQKGAVFPILLLVLLCIFTRLPQLLSPNLILDGDECILGLMAKHMLTGKDFSAFFYGQSYGFSLIETSFVSIAYCIGGYSDISVKLAMLALWTTGIVFFYKTLRQLCNSQTICLLVTILFIFTPAWGAWSMKARGGYLSAFTTTWLLTYLLFNKKAGGQLYFTLAGLLPPVIFMSQALWLPGLLPLIILRMSAKSTRKYIIWFLAGMFAGAILLIWAMHNASDFWHPNAIGINSLSFMSAGKLRTVIFNSLHGYYYLTEIYQSPLSNSIFAWLLMVLGCLLLVPGSLFATRRFRCDPLCFAVVLSVIFSIAYLLLTDGVTPRYALPLSGYVILGIALCLDRVNRKALTVTVLAPLYICGAVAMYMFKDFKFHTTGKADLEQFIGSLEQKGVHHVFCTDGLLQWQLTFYSNEQVISRFYGTVDRYPAYVRAVNDAYRHGENTAVIGYDNDNVPKDLPLVKANGYFMYLSPSADELQKLQFAF
jgi:hypothetical protein